MNVQKSVDTLAALEEQASPGRLDRADDVSVSGYLEEGDVYTAVTQDKYTTRIDAQRRRVKCTCADFKHRKRVCKHIIALARHAALANMLGLPSNGGGSK